MKFIKFCIVFIGLLAWGHSVEASPSATLTVCPSGCDHTSIQAAVFAANAGDTIQLFFLNAHTETDIILNKDITIEGLDRNSTIVQAAATLDPVTESRVFTVLAGNTVTLQNFTIRYGYISGGGSARGGGLWVRSESGSVANVTLNQLTIRDNSSAYGGGIANEGVLTLNDVSVDDNTAAIGGGIYNESGANMLTVTDSGISDNVASATGGGIYNTGSAMTIDGGSRIFRNVADNGGGMLSYAAGYTIVIDDTRIADNELTPTPNDRCGAGLHVRGHVIIHDSEIVDNDAMTEDGGGLCMSLATADISRTIISGNSADIGGGIMLRGQDTLTMTQVALLENVADFSGGGLYASQANVKLTNVTIAENTAAKNGGGINVFGGSTVSIANATITQNIANFGDSINGNGGGLYIVGSDSDVILRSVIIAENLVQLERNAHHDCFGDIHSANYSLIGNLGGSADPCSWQSLSAGMIHSVDPQLGAVTGSDHERHYPLLNISPAIDAGVCLDADSQPLNVDQRNYAMPVDGNGDTNANCDMGSIEYNGVPTVVGISQQEAVNSEQWLIGLLALLVAITLGAGWSRFRRI